MCNLPEFSNRATPVARKDHKCGECGGMIPRGRRYVSYTGRWDGEVATYRFHRTCWQIREACHRHLTSEAGGRFRPEEMPAFGRLVEWTAYDAQEGAYFPPWWPQRVDQSGVTWGVFISPAALAAYVETQECLLAEIDARAKAIAAPHTPEKVT